MSAVATAVVGAGIGGAIISSGAAKDAAGQQADAARNAAGLQYQEFQQQRDDQAPWRQAGAQALSQMNDPYFQQNFGAMDLSQDPGYQFRMDQGQKALEASAAARGGLMSGNTLQGISQYGQDYASGEYQNAYNRFTNNQSNRFNRLSSIAGLGQTANNQVGQAGMNMSNNVGNIMTGNANAQGAATMAQGQIWGNTLSSMGTGLANNWQQTALMNRLFPQGGAPGGSAQGTYNASQAVNSNNFTMPNSSAGFGAPAPQPSLLE